MKKIYYLKTCDTCRRIMKEVGVDASFDSQNVKETPISAVQLDELKNRTGSYESLFNKRSNVYKSEGLKDKTLSEDDVRSYILKEYTLLKRPVFLFDDAIFVGNAKKDIEALKSYLNK
jgi:arsenate reductase (glutaredoxin)